MKALRFVLEVLLTMPACYRAGRDAALKVLDPDEVIR